MTGETMAKQNTMQVAEKAALERSTQGTVLIVDDSRLQRRILLSSIRKWGYDVVEAESGDDALELC